MFPSEPTTELDDRKGQIGTALRLLIGDRTGRGVWKREETPHGRPWWKYQVKHPRPCFRAPCHRDWKDASPLPAPPCCEWRAKRHGFSYVLFLRVKGILEPRRWCHAYEAAQGFPRDHTDLSK